MIKLVSILAALLILIQSFNISFGDIAQLDELLEHAAFHKTEYGDNIFVFISKHYGELKADHNKKHQEEKEDHEKLPFENHSSSQHALNAFVLFETLTPRHKIDVIRIKSISFFYLHGDSSSHESGIFQPPRNV